MSASQKPYDADLASVHDVGFTGFIDKLAPELLGILRAVGIHDGCVIDLGCGGGVWAQALENAGYSTVDV